MVYSGSLQACSRCKAAACPKTTRQKRRADQPLQCCHLMSCQQLLTINASHKHPTSLWFLCCLHLAGAWLYHNMSPSPRPLKTPCRGSKHAAKTTQRPCRQVDLAFSYAKMFPARLSAALHDCLPPSGALAPMGALAPVGALAPGERQVWCWDAMQATGSGTCRYAKQNFQFVPADMSHCSDAPRICQHQHCACHRDPPTWVFRSHDLAQAHVALQQQAAPAPWQVRAGCCTAQHIPDCLRQQQVAAQEHLQGSCGDSHAVYRGSTGEIVPAWVPASRHTQCST